MSGSAAIPIAAISPQHSQHLCAPLKTIGVRVRAYQRMMHPQRKILRNQDLTQIANTCNFLVAPFATR